MSPIKFVVVLYIFDIKNICCVFGPVEGWFAHRSLVKINSNPLFLFYFFTFWKSDIQMKPVLRCQADISLTTVVLMIMAFFVVIVKVVIQNRYWSLLNYDPNYDIEKSLLVIVGFKNHQKGLKYIYLRHPRGYKYHMISV